MHEDLVRKAAETTSDAKYPLHDRNPPDRFAFPRTLTLTTKKILITGFDGADTEDNVRAWLGQFGPVAHVEIIRDGNADEPVVLAEMEIGDGAAAYLLSHLSDHWHNGKLVNARLLHH